eukprot:g2130.t2
MKSIRNKNSQQRRVRSVSCSATPAKVITEPLRMLALRRSLTLASHNRSSFRQFASFQPPSLSISTPSPTTGDSVGLPQEKSKSNSTRQRFANNVGIKQHDVSTRYTVYKSRAAVEFTPLAPTIVVDERGYKNVQRQGCLLLIFAQSTGTRSYDWDNKIIFALSVGELGQILATPTQEHEFFHDPGMQTRSPNLLNSTFFDFFSFFFFSNKVGCGLVNKLWLRRG